MKTLNLLIVSILFSSMLSGKTVYQQDTIATRQGDLIITFLGHGTLYFTFNGKVIHIDPVGQYADYTTLPKADLIFVTHQHGDHLDAEAIHTLSGANTELVFTKTCAENYAGEGKVTGNGDTLELQGIKVEVVPAYNLVHKRDNGKPYHPKGEGNGYIFNFGGTRVYVAGDTENIPEMKEIKDIDVAFLPMNLPYTMTPEMVVEAVKVLRPKILYPYHYGNTNTDDLLKLMKGIDYCEVRIRDMR